jgi:hypothetical protein
MTPLQRELYDLMSDRQFIEGWVLVENEGYEQFCEMLKKDIKKMNAAELRHNIKVWKETE